MANKLANGEIITVSWHFGDLKVSHKESFEVTIFSQYPAMIYREKLKFHRGNIHEYLGMDLYY